MKYIFVFLSLLSVSTSLIFPRLIQSSIRKYPYSEKYYEHYLRRLNSKNITIQDTTIMGYNPIQPFIHRKLIIIRRNETEGGNSTIPVIISYDYDDEEEEIEEEHAEEEEPTEEPEVHSSWYRMRREPKVKRSEHFEIISESEYKFTDIGGYDNIKTEIMQCVDLLQNSSKYARFNVRVPKGVILEGPPGNGKTLLAKGFAGEVNASFIAVSGSEFQDKYVGVGAGKIRELFELAKKNKPCVIFIDEIDAVGRKRTGDGETANTERDSTLNELLVALDGFKNSSGVFLIGATNRGDLLDPALLRPGRIDKRIYIDMPDEKTRKSIIDIHIRGKPYDETITKEDLVYQTAGFSGAKIENLLNEAMLLALRNNKEEFTSKELDEIMNRVLAGWLPNEHVVSNDTIERIAIHEMGHAIMGVLSKHHANVSKIIINLSSPKSPGYTVFETEQTPLYTRETLFEHLMILLAGRVAEQVIYDVSITTGAINDFEEALHLAEKMITYYGMGKHIIYPNSSDKYKEMIDNEVSKLIKDAYQCTEVVLQNMKPAIIEGANRLKETRTMKVDELMNIIHRIYPDMADNTI